MQTQLATFLESLRTSGLLGAEQFDKLVAWSSAPGADPQVIAKDLVKNGGLTAFQVKMFWKGRGAELFLGQYVLMDRLGEGGMGEVFKAKHRRMNRDVALKVIRKERLASTDAIRRFGREIQAAAQLAHENIVMAYDADQAGDRHFFAMEFVEGTNLAKLVKDKGPLPIAQACDCIRQAALGLEHAFERGMVHRDIKPSNLLLGKNNVLKILDMGLARLQESPDREVESRITQEGLIVGTPDYLSPEQARNSRTADIRADIYSLGCTFFYLLCAHPPYQGGTPTEKMLRHTTDPTPNLTRPDASPALEAIVQRMMAKRMEDRFQTPAEIAYALQALMGPAPASSTMHPRIAQATTALSSRHLPIPQAPMPLALPEEVEEPRTDSQFRLPAPRPPKKDIQERTRWNLPIALGASALVLGLIALAIFLIFRRNAAPTGPELDKEYVNNHSMTLKLIPAGSFDMGAPEGESGRGNDEGPVHTVKISQHFYMGSTEVTARQYKSVVGKLPFAYKDDLDELDVPIVNVAINETENFIRRLNADVASRKSGWEYRLPTEAEWEYACRAGTKGRFHVGDNLKSGQAFFNDPNAKAPGKVGQYPANAWGLHDMHGNAGEWVMDYYDDMFYSSSPTDDPKGPTQRKTIYVVRGGSYLDAADGCRSAHRKGVKMETRSSEIGFRIVYVQVSKP